MDVYCGNLVELLEVNLTILWRPCGQVPLQFLILGHHTDPQLLISFGAGSPDTALSPQNLPLMSLCFDASDALYSLSAPQSVDKGLRCVLSSSMDPRRLISFSACSTVRME